MYTHTSIHKKTVSYSTRTACKSAKQHGEIRSRNTSRQIAIFLFFFRRSTIGSAVVWMQPYIYYIIYMSLERNIYIHKHSHRSLALFHILHFVNLFLATQQMLIAHRLRTFENIKWERKKYRCSLIVPFNSAVTAAYTNPDCINFASIRQLWDIFKILQGRRSMPPCDCWDSKKQCKWFKLSATTW